MSKAKKLLETFGEDEDMGETADLPTIDATNVFDIAAALHAFLTYNHEGQGSERYSLLSRSEFKPGPMWEPGEEADENEWYSAIESLDDYALGELMDRVKNFGNEEDEDALERDIEREELARDYDQEY